jgi:hypothetical protein
MMAFFSSLVEGKGREALGYVFYFLLVGGWCAGGWWTVEAAEGRSARRCWVWAVWEILCANTRHSWVFPRMAECHAGYGVLRSLGDALMVLG